MHPRMTTEEIVLKKKIQSFKTIYRAFHEVGTNIYSTDFLTGKENLTLKAYEKEIEDHCKIPENERDKAYSQVYQAWQLAKVYYDSCTEENEELFDKIYHAICVTIKPRQMITRYLKPKYKQYVTEKPNFISKFNFFKKSNSPEMIEMDAIEKSVGMNDIALEEKHLSLHDIENKKLNAEIIWHIYYHLANPIPLGEIWPQPRTNLVF